MHYFFEGQGSLTTLTKAETKNHKQQVSEFMQSLEPVQITEPEENKDGIIAIAR
jgi:hypothetical protein